MRWYTWLGLVAVFGLSGCAHLACFPSCQRHAQNSTSLVEFLYPNGAPPPAQDSQPQLHLPLRVGLAFLPSNGEPRIGPDAAQKEALLQEIRKHFVSRKFIAEIVLIPDYYLLGKRGFEGLEGVQRLYGIDLMALVSYDQVAHEDDNRWSLGYLTIVGAYVLKGTRHDVSTLVDENRRLRETAAEAFAAATQQMIDHFDGALTAFEAEVRDGKANVRVVSNHGKPASGGLGGMDWLALLFLAPIAVAAAKRRD